MEFKNICPICLRTNRKLKEIPTVLSEYHNKLTDYTFLLKNPRYCCYCECLLRKTYDFQQKCATASNILKNWLNSITTNEAPINQLHLKLHPVTLGVWTPENNKVFTYTDEDNASELIVIGDCEDVKPDIDHLETKMLKNVNSNETKDEFMEMSIQNETLFTKELKQEHCHTIEVSDISCQNPNSSNIIFIKNNDSNIINTEVSRIFNADNHMVKRADEKIIDAAKQANTSSISIVEVQNKGLKRYIETDIEDIQKHMSRINNDDEDDIELICLNDNDNKNDDIILIDDENEYLDDSLNNNDDCDDYLYTPPRKKKTKKMTLCELANLDLSDEDLVDNYETSIPNTKDDNNKKMLLIEKNIVSKLESVNKTLDSIYENWEVTSLLIHTSIIDKRKKDEMKKMTQEFLTERKTLKPGKIKPVTSVLAKVRHVNADLDLIIGKCANTVDNYKIGLCSSKERLKSVLQKWGELKSPDGLVFDKDKIMSRLDVVAERIVKRLLNLMLGKKRLGVDAVKLLGNIQNRPLYTQYESVFDIEYLTTEKEKLAEFERRKTYECYVKAEYKCEICYQGFKNEGFLVHHKKYYHDNSPGLFSCHICHITRKLRKTYNTHRNSHKAVYKCKLCPLVTYYKSSMINHYEQHKGTTYKCEKCGLVFKSKSMYLYHQSRFHPRGVHICRTCGNGFISQMGLHSHVLRKHPDESSASAEGSRFGCEECTLTFPSEAACHRHRRIAHGANVKRTYSCIHRSLRKKLIMTCPECKAVGHGHGWMVKHFDIEHPSLDVAAVYADKRKYLCDICGKGFSHRHSFADHTNIHSGVTFPCPTCNKRFSTKLKLRHHSLFHGPPNYRCERCDKKFYSSSNLYLHMRTHIGDRCFKCHVCAKGFLHRSSLKEHIRGVHNHERRRRKKPVAADGKKLDATDASSATIVK